MRTMRGIDARRRIDPRVIGNGVRSFVPDCPNRAGTGDGSGGENQPLPAGGRSGRVKQTEARMFNMLIL